MVLGRGYQVEGTEAQLREVTGWQPQTRVMLGPRHPSCQISVPISELLRVLTHVPWGLWPPAFSDEGGLMVRLRGCNHPKQLPMTPLTMYRFQGPGSSAWWGCSVI